MRNGFSLIELSIVLVILGLLTGGVLTGQNLIRAAELRSITTEFQNYQASVMTFRNKYMALPGDMVNATSFWASAGGTGADAICFAVESTGAETCNGNGDGSIGELGAPSERYRFWQHLANAGLVQGSYTGATGAESTDHAVADQNVPSSKVSNGVWYASERPPNITGQFIFDKENIFLLGAASNTSLPFGDLLLPEEMWNIDIKIDDGKPGLGGIMSMDI